MVNRENYAEVLSYEEGITDYQMPDKGNNK